MAEDINISPDMINNLVNMLKNSSSSSSSNADNNENPSNRSSASQNTSSIDIETIMKIKSIMETLNNKDDPKSNLLYSLKPYLRKSKQDKLDQYINILKISQVANLFKTEKGDTK
jgi:hypothetical protein